MNFVDPLTACGPADWQQVARQQVELQRWLKEKSVRKKTIMMRAKLSVNSVTESKNDKGEVTSMVLKMNPVTSKPFDKDGLSEDNSFSRWTPSGSLELTITNPALFGKFTIGQAFYADFTEAK